MSCYFAKTLHCSFGEAVQRTTDALKNAGFGIITVIDVKETFKEKLGSDFGVNSVLINRCISITKGQRWDLVHHGRIKPPYNQELCA